VARLKKKVTALGISWLLASVWVVAGGQVVHADSPQVLLVERAHARPELRVTLQIQLMGVAELGVRSDLRGDTTAARIASAAVLARSETALAVIWSDPPITRDDGLRDVVLYVVGNRAGRALVELVRVPASDGPELDRSLALKVREVIVELIDAQGHAPSAALLVTQPPVSSAVGERARAAADSGEPARAVGARWGARVFAGPGLVWQPGLARIGLELGAGPTLAHGPYLLGATVALAWTPEVTQRRDERVLRLWELTPKLQLELERSFGLLSLGVQGGLSVSTIHATGALDTRQRSASLSLFAGLVGLRVELAIARALALRLRCDLQVFARHQRFAVDDQTLVDLGRARGLFGLDLVWRSGP